MADIKTSYIISIVADTTKMSQLIKTITDMDGSITKVKPKVSGLGGELLSIASRAAKVIPIWRGLVAAWNALGISAQSIMKDLIDLDRYLARAMTLSPEIKNVNEFRAALGNLARTLSIETGYAASDLVETFNKFKGAGLDASTSYAGMVAAARMARASMGDLTGSAQTLSDLYVLLGDSVSDATTPMEKMTKIAGLIAILDQDNTYSLKELTDSFKRSAGAARAFGVTFEELSAILAATNTMMQRGTTGGTQFSYALAQMVAHLDLVREFLNDPSLTAENPFDVYLRVVTKLSDKLKAGFSRGEIIKEIFGVRATTTVGGLTEAFDLLIRNLETVKMSTQEVERQFNKKYDIQIKTLNVQIDRLKQNLLGFGDLFRVFGTTDYGIQALINFNNILIGTRTLIEEIILLLSKLSSTDLSKKISANFADAIPLLAAIKLLKNLGEAKSAATQKNKGQQQSDLTRLTAEDTAKAAKKTAEDVAKAEEKRKETLIENLDLFNQLRLYGFSDLEIAKQKLAYSKKYLFDLKEEKKLQKDILELEIKQVEEISNKLRGSVESNLTELLKGNVGIKDFSSNIKEAMNDALIEQVAGGITDVLASTGMFKAFGEIGTKIRNSFDGIAGQIRQAHIDGIKQGFENVKTGQAVSNSLSSLGGLGSLGSFAGFFNFLQGIGGLSGGSASAAGALTPTGAYGTSTSLQSQLQVWNALGGSSTGAATGATGAAGGAGGISGSSFLAMLTGGMSAYQGFSSGDTAGGISGSVKAIGGATMLIPGMQPVGAAMIGGAMLYDMFAPLFKTKKSSTETVTTTEISVASKIDISNRKLEMINRNLLAFKTTFETYILPESAFYAEKRNTMEDQFALSASR